MLKNWKHNIFYFVMLSFYFIVYRWISYSYNKKAIRFEVSQLELIVIAIFLYVAFGILLGVAHISRQFRHKGLWKFDVPRFIILGIPSLIFSISNILFMVIPFKISQPFFSFIFTSGKNLTTLFQILFGYVLMTCFVRIREEVKEDIS